MSAYFERAEPVPTSTGNLFGPSSDAAVADGELRNPTHRKTISLAAASLATAAGLVALKGKKLLPRSVDVTTGRITSGRRS